MDRWLILRLAIFSLTGCHALFPTDKEGEIKDTAEPQVYCVDNDGDRYVSEENKHETLFSAEQPDGYTLCSDVINYEDCVDTDASIHPGASEFWYDGVDQDCQGDDDYDADGDNYRSARHEDGDDCDDNDINVNPGRVETWYDGVDQNCDGKDDYDADEDGERHEDYGGHDCDDANAAINSAATETWYDGVDQDCDGWADYDADRDGYSSETHLPLVGQDCDDTDPEINPGVEEVWYDGVDQDCAEDNDYDADGDGYDKAYYNLLSDDRDCDDTDTDVNPGMDEICGDGKNNDCSDEPDESCQLDADINVDESDYYKLEHESYTMIGSSVSAGDVNGEGRDAVLIGAPSDNTGATSSGAIYLVEDFSSQGSHYNLDYADAVLTGESANASLGYSLASGIDVNGDGYDDFLTGATEYDDDHGIAYLVPGPQREIKTITEVGVSYVGEEEDDLVGASLSFLTDFDGTGQPDLVIGAPGYDDNTGAVYLVNDPVVSVGSSYQLSSIRDVQYDGEAGSDEAGFSVSDAGDMNGDGYTDLIIGAPSEDSSYISGGAAYLVFGSASPSGENNLSSADVKYTANYFTEMVGTSVAGVGDVDADGFDDVLIGVPQYSDDDVSNTGAAYLVHGDMSTGTYTLHNIADTIFWGEEEDDKAGSVVSAAGDTNNDGFADFLIGAPQAARDGRTNAGAAYLVRGSDGLEDMPLSDSHVSFLSEDTSCYYTGLGFSLGFGDLNGDAYSDLILGASNDENGCVNKNQGVYVVEGTGE